MYGTCELKRGVCVCVRVSVSVRLCVTDLRRWTWVMMFTTLFHHLSPNNTWNPWNYFSLAISCKIFTFSSLIFPPRFLAARSRAVARVCACARTHTRTKTRTPCPPHPILTPSLPLCFVWARTRQELRGSREEEEEVCGGMRGHGLNVSILALNMYVILQLFFIKCVSKTPGLRKTIKRHLVINMLEETWNWWCFLILHCPVGHYFLSWINILLWVLSSGGLEHSQRLLHLPLVSYARKLWTRKFCAQDCGVSRYAHSHTQPHILSHVHTQAT